jgi:multicomponent Na+:H+ antiporter subunit D
LAFLVARRLRHRTGSGLHPPGRGSRASWACSGWLEPGRRCSPELSTHPPSSGSGCSGGIGIIRRHRLATGARRLRGEGPAITTAAAVIVIGALGLADLPPSASSVGKGLLVATAGSAGGLVEAVIALTVVGTSGAVLVSAARVWRGESWDNPPPSEDVAETAAGWGNLTLLAPPVLLIGVALGLGLVPHLAQHADNAAASFADRRGYSDAVFGLSSGSGRAPTAPAATIATYGLDLAEAGGAVLIAAVILGQRQLTRVLATAVGGLRRLHNGYVGDQVAWVVLGVAILAGLSGLALRLGPHRLTRGDPGRR